MGARGYEPLFLWDEEHVALGLVRGAVGLLKRVTSRANVFVPGADLGFGSVEVVLSPAAVRFQEQVLSPIGDRLHPFYFKLMRPWHERRQRL
jgi:hypothetical protein